MKKIFFIYPFLAKCPFSRYNTCQKSRMASTNSFLVILVLIYFVSAGYSGSSLRSEFYKELTCPKEASIFTGKINYAWLLFPSRWYIPMGSEHVYRLSAEILLGRPARNSEELDLIDLSVNSVIGTFKISGFGSKSFRKACAPINRPTNTFPRNLLETTCFGLWGTRGSNVEPAAKAVDSIIWTDNENAVLITPCNQATKTYDWFVLTKRRTLSDETKSSILTEISKLGFNPNNAAYYDYENKRLISGTTTSDSYSTVSNPQNNGRPIPAANPLLKYRPPSYVSNTPLVYEPDLNPPSKYGPPTTAYTVSEKYSPPAQKPQSFHSVPPPKSLSYLNTADEYYQTSVLTPIYTTPNEKFLQYIYQN